MGSEKLFSYNIIALLDVRNERGNNEYVISTGDFIFRIPPLRILKNFAGFAYFVLNVCILRRPKRKYIYLRRKALPAAAGA